MKSIASSLQFTPDTTIYTPVKGWKLISALSYSPNNYRLVAATSDSFINVFNESNERKDKFQLRSASGQKISNFLVTGLAWSPDSTCLAVGQTDNALFVYNLGTRLTDKKSLLARFIFQAAVSAVFWPKDSPDNAFVGLENGSIQMCNMKSQKATEVFLKQEVPVVSIIGSPLVPGALTFFIDGSVAFVDITGRKAVQVTELQVQPVCVTSVRDKYVVAVGAGNRIQILQYDKTNVMLANAQVIHIKGTSQQKAEAPITTARGTTIQPGSSQIRTIASSPSYPACILCGGSVVYALFCNDTGNNRFVYRKVLENNGCGVQSILSCAFKPDSSEIVTGSACGQIQVFSAYISRYNVRNEFTVTQATPAKCLVKNLKNGHLCEISTAMGSIIQSVKIVGDKDVQLLESVNGPTEEATPQTTSTDNVNGDKRDTTGNQGGEKQDTSGTATVDGKQGPVRDPEYYSHFFVVCRTDRSLIIKNVETSLTTEIPWAGIGKESYVFDQLQTNKDKESFGLIFNAGELTVMKIGESSILGTCRIYKSSMHLLSLRNILPTSDGEPTTILAHLSDSKRSLRITDIKQSRALMDIHHNADIDWIELSPNGTRILFRDTNGTILFCKVPKAPSDKVSPVVLLNTPLSPYVQWVPGAEVVVAQEVDMSGPGDVLVWYSLEGSVGMSSDSGLSYAPVDEAGAGVGSQYDQLGGSGKLGGSSVDSGGRSETLSTTLFTPVRYASQGREIIDIVRDKNSTKVLIADRGVMNHEIELDNKLILFGEALESGDLDRATRILKVFDLSRQREMSKNIAEIALNISEPNFSVASKALALRGEYSKSMFCKAAAKEIPKFQPEIRQTMAQIQKALLEGKMETAEALLFKINRGADAVGLYKELNRYEDAIRVAKLVKMPDEKIQILEDEALRWMSDTNQTKLAGNILSEKGDVNGALNMFIQGKWYKEAVLLIRTHPKASFSQDIIDDLISSLEENRMEAAAGAVCEVRGNNKRAMELYRKGKSFHEATKIARREFPQEVVAIEAEWGRALAIQGKWTQAITHLVEAKLYTEAVDAAIAARNWPTVKKFMSSLPLKESREYSFKAGEMLIQQGLVDDAVEWFVQSGEFQLAVQQLIGAGRVDLALDIVKQHLMGSQQIQCCKQAAADLESCGKRDDAVRFLLLGNLIDEAIALRTRADEYQEILKLVRQYRPNLVTETLTDIGMRAERSGDVTGAVEAYVEAGEWKKASALLTSKGKYDEACAVVQAHGKTGDIGRVAYTWATDIGIPQIGPVLQNKGYLAAAVSYATSTGLFDRALELAVYSPTKETITKDVLLKKGYKLSQDGRFADAEGAFLQAGKPESAVQMWIEQTNWDAAMKVAKTASNPDLQRRVQLAQADFLVRTGEVARAEDIYVNCGQSDKAVKAYKDKGMWNDALRVAKQYAPDMVRVVAEEYAIAEQSQKANRDNNNFGNQLDRRTGASRGNAAKSGMGQSQSGKTPARDLIAQASAQQTNGNWDMAVDLLLQAATQGDMNDREATEALMEACTLATSHLTAQNARRAIIRAMKGLGKMGFVQMAIDLAMRNNMQKEAAVFASKFGMDESAERIATDAKATGTLNTVKNVKMKRLIEADDAEALFAAGDYDNVLKIVAQRGMWERGIAMASTANEEVLSNFVVKYARAKSVEDPEAAAKLLALGPVGMVENPIPPVLGIGTDVGDIVEISRQVLRREMAEPEWDEAMQREVIQQGAFGFIRDSLWRLTEAFKVLGQRAEEKTKEVWRYFWAAHLVCMLASHIRHKRTTMAAHTAMALINYIDILPVDRCVILAGRACAAVRRDAEALALYNIGIDIVDCIASGDKPTTPLLGDLSCAVYGGSSNIHFPRVLFVDKSTTETIRNWVLSKSLDYVTGALELGSCHCGHELWTYALECASCKSILGECCAITGQILPEGTQPVCVCGVHAKTDAWDEVAGVHAPCPLCGAIGR